MTTGVMRPAPVYSPPHPVPAKRQPVSARTPRDPPSKKMYFVVVVIFFSSVGTGLAVHGLLVQFPGLLQISL